MKQKVFLGISGGVDSAASVLILKEQGYDVVGVYLKTVGELDSILELEQSLNIDIIVSDVSEEFRGIVDNFLVSYIKGETPSPCVECNEKIKWNTIRNIAKHNGASYWATGHYCNVERFNDHLYIKKGIDPIKDQSYYLWRLDQEILDGALFPLGHLYKSDIYKLMSSKGYKKLVDKPQSMSICFLKGESCNEFLKKNIPNISTLSDGEITDTEGNVIGTHDGYPLYTIAQKKGLALPNKKCIVEIDPLNNRLVAGYRESLYSSTIDIRDWKLTSVEEVLNSQRLTAIVRGVGENPVGYSRVVINSPYSATVELSSKAWAVTKGQPIVFYIDDRVVGGGYVESYR